MRKTRKRRYYPGASSRVSIQQLDLYARSLSAAWDQLGLRSLKGQDFYAVERLRAGNHAWLASWESNAPPGMAPAITVEEYVASMAKNAREGLGLCFTTLPEGHLAGQVSVSSVQRGASQSAAVGYWVASNFTGRSLAPLAMATVLDWYLGEYSLHHVEISIRPENASSLRVTERLGIRKGGLQQRYLYINGAWSNHRYFAMTLEEWQPDYFISQLLPE